MRNVAVERRPRPQTAPGHTDEPVHEHPFSAVRARVRAKVSSLAARRLGSRELCGSCVQSGVSSQSQLSSQPPQTDSLVVESLEQEDDSPSAQPMPRPKAAMYSRAVKTQRSAGRTGTLGTASFSNRRAFRVPENVKGALEKSGSLL